MTAAGADPDDLDRVLRARGPGLGPDRVTVLGGGGLQVDGGGLDAVDVDVCLPRGGGAGDHPGRRPAGERPGEARVLGGAGVGLVVGFVAIFLFLLLTTAISFFFSGLEDV